jgi:membrane protein YdbS with pleckstrin-like domain
VSLRRRWFAVARLAVVVWLTLLVVATIMGEWLDDWASLVRVTAITLGVLFPLWQGIAETLRYRNERWALGDDQVAFRGGAVTTTLVVIPRVRTQGTAISANWFQRRLGIADITVDTASPTVAGSGRDLYLDDASSLAAAVLASADAEGGV